MFLIFAQKGTTMLTHFAIQPVTPQDLSALQKIAKETFIEAFGPDNTQRNMDIYVAEAFNPTKMAEEINNPNSRLYFLKKEDSIIGYLKLNKGSAQTETVEGNALEVERIYVQGLHHGTGAGQILMDKAIEIATAEKYDYLWLGVWEHNPKAIRFYEKNGFYVFGKHTFLMVDDPQQDFLMKRDLAKITT